MTVSLLEIDILGIPKPQSFSACGGPFPPYKSWHFEIPKTPRSQNLRPLLTRGGVSNIISSDRTLGHYFLKISLRISNVSVFGRFRVIVHTLSSVLSLGNEVPKCDKCAARFQFGLSY